MNENRWRKLSHPTECTKAERQEEAFRNALGGITWFWVGVVILVLILLSCIFHPVSIPDSDCDAYTACSQ